MVRENEIRDAASVAAWHLATPAHGTLLRHVRTRATQTLACQRHDACRGRPEALAAAPHQAHRPSLSEPYAVIVPSRRRRRRAAGTPPGPARRRGTARPARAPDACAPARRDRHAAAARRASGSAAARRRPRQPGRCSRAPRTRDALDAELLARADDHAVRRASVRSTYSGSAAATPSPLRWPTVKWWNAAVRAERPRPRRHDLARRVRRAPRGGRGSAPCPCRPGSRGPASRRATRPAAPPRRRQRAHLRLGQLRQREAHPRQRRRRQRGEHVGLVLGRVGGDPQQPVVGHPRVVAGRRARRARADQRARASRPAARARCSPRTGSGSPPPRSRPGTGRRRPPGTPAAGPA